MALLVQVPTLASLVATFTIDTGQDQISLEDKRSAVSALAGRVLGRKRKDRGESKMESSLAKDLRFYFESDSEPIKAVLRLSHEIQIARLFLDAYNVAWGGDFNAQ